VTYVAEPPTGYPGQQQQRASERDLRHIRRCAHRLRLEVCLSKNLVEAVSITDRHPLITICFHQVHCCQQDSARQR